MYIIWFTANLLRGLDHFSLDFKTLLLRLKVEMRFKALHKSNICFVVKIHQWLRLHQWWRLWLLHIIIEWKSIHYFVCDLETPLSTAEENLAYKWVMEQMRLECRNLSFCLGINRFWIWVNLKFTNICQKIKVFGNDWAKPKSDINPSHTKTSKLAEHHHLLQGY